MPAKKKTEKKPKKSPKKKIKSVKKPKAPKEKLVAKVEHIFDKINVITMTLKTPLKAGDIIHIKGHTTDFVQAVESMQIEHKEVLKAKKGDGIGIKVKDTVRDTDKVYLADKKTVAAFKDSTTPPQQTKFVSF